MATNPMKEEVEDEYNLTNSQLMSEFAIRGLLKRKSMDSFSQHSKKQKLANSNNNNNNDYDSEQTQEMESFLLNSSKNVNIDASEIYEKETNDMDQQEIEEMMRLVDEEEKKRQEEEWEDAFQEEIKYSKPKPIFSIQTSDIMIPSPKISPFLPPFYEDMWNNYYVRLPCSPKNKYEKNEQNLNKWYLIQSILSRPILNSIELEEAIQGYNKHIYDFSGLHHFLNELLTPNETKKFFSVTLPNIIRLALELPVLCPTPIPLLLPGEERSITLSQFQISSLLANAFLCTFPKQGGNIQMASPASTEINAQEMEQDSQSTQPLNSTPKDSVFQFVPIYFPSINFDTLFIGTGSFGECSPTQAEKLKCILHYFDRISSRLDDPSNERYVTFSRKVLKNPPNWENNSKTLPRLVVKDLGFIEDEANHLQVDFANKMIGGGVLGRGCIQEEIRFSISTECIVSLLFTARLEDNECVFIKGTERFCNYNGYSQSFEFKGSYVDTTPKDDKGHKKTTIVVIDALYFGSMEESRITQYKKENILRELNKAYCGFSNPDFKKISTGNWGCGAFGGYHDLKFIIQLMAAAEAEKDLTYFTFEVQGLSSAILEFYDILKKKQVTVGDLWKELVLISEELKQCYDESSSFSITPPQLFRFLIKKYSPDQNIVTPMEI